MTDDAGGGPRARRSCRCRRWSGQDDAKLALLLLGRATDGSAACSCGARRARAKSTLARGLAALLPGSAPFVELPLGATEDRVVGIARSRRRP